MIKFLNENRLILLLEEYVFEFDKYDINIENTDLVSYKLLESNYTLLKTDYTFDFYNSHASFLQTNVWNYLRISVLIPVDYLNDVNLSEDQFDVQINIDDLSMFYLISENQYKELKYLYNIDKFDLLKTISLEKLSLVDVTLNNIKYKSIPFYVVIKSSESTTYTSNLLVKVKIKNKYYCYPLTVSAIISEENLNTINFCDDTGKIFCFDEYTKYPIGYETIENKYIFWVNSEYTNYLSVNNWYLQCIRLLIPCNGLTNLQIANIDILNLLIKSDSTVFKLVSNRAFQNLKSFNNINISNYCKKYLSAYDLDCTRISESYYDINSKEIFNDYLLIPFYVAVNSKEEATWVSNILINVTILGKNYYCPITVGAEIKDEEEALIINGKNMGINLPKDIIKAVYSEPISNYSINETLYNQKIKEYLLNYMQIKCECGSYKSAINSLKWFEWGNNISIYKLLKINNDFINLYLRDNFSVKSDVLKTYVNFRNTTMLSLLVAGNYEYKLNTQDIFSNIINNNNTLNYNDEFWGEGLPEYMSNFDNQYYIPHIRNYNNLMQDEGVLYLRNYYDFTFNELATKLALLEMYYEKYFLPIHIDIFNSTISFICPVNDVKMISNISDLHYNEGLIFVGEKTPKDIEVIFPKDNNILLYHQTIILDDNYNCFTDINLKTYSYYADIKKMLEEGLTEYGLTTYENWNNFWTPEICKKLLNEIIEYCLSIIGLDKIVKESLPKPYDKTEYDKQQIIIEYAKNNNKTYLNILLLSIYNISLNKLISNYVKDKRGIYEVLHIILNNPKHLKQSDILLFFYNKFDINMLLKRMLNIFNTKYNEEHGYLYIDDVVAKIPIEIKSDTLNYVDCVLILSRNRLPIFERHFRFTQTKGQQYDGFVISPRYFKEFFDYTYWYDQDYRIDLLVNDYWYHYDFKLLMVNFNIDMGKLEYHHGDYSQVKIVYRKMIEELEDKNPERLLIDTNISYYDYLRWENADEINTRKFLPELFIEADEIGFIDDLEPDVQIIDEIYSFLLWLVESRILIQRESECRLPTIADIDLISVANSAYYKAMTNELFDENRSPNIIIKPNEYIDYQANKYIEDLYISSDYKYQNIVMYCDLYKGDTRLKYDPKTDKEDLICTAKDIYNLLFNYDIKEDYIEYETFDDFPEVGEEGVIYFNKYEDEFHIRGSYHWDGEKYYHFPRLDLGIKQRLNITKTDLENNKYLNFDFDGYLMHDDDYWYIVFISKNPICELYPNTYKITDFEDISNILRYNVYEKYMKYGYYVIIDNTANDNNADDVNNSLDYEKLKDTTYNLRNIKSYKRFLINRMKYTSIMKDYVSVNHFSQDDVIVSRLISDSKVDMNLFFDKDNSPKWEYSNIDLNPVNVVTTSSNTNYGIISLEKSLMKYKRGYYNVSIRYNIDDMVQHQQIKTNKFKVL